MVANYFTLVHIASDLNRRIPGSRVTSAFSQQSKELTITLEHPHAGHADILFVSCVATAPCMYLRERGERKRRNSADVLEEAVGKVVKEVRIDPADREITISLEPKLSLVVRLFGSEPNAYLCDSTEMIRDSFLNKKKWAGTALPSLPERTRPWDVHLPSLRGLKQDSGNASLSRMLRTHVPQLGSTLAREVLYRSGLDPETSVEGMTERAYGRLTDSLKRLLEELAGSPSPQIYFDGSTPVLFSIINLEHLEGMRVEHIPSLHDAIRVFTGRTEQRARFSELRKAVVAPLQKELHHLDESIGKVEAQAEPLERADAYESLGRLVTANLHALSRGMRQADLPANPGAPGEVTTVALDPNLTPARNAERYYEKAKRVRRTAAEHSTRVRDLRNRRKLAATLLEETTEINDEAALESFMDHHRADLERFGIKPSIKRKEKEERIPFRIFSVSGGYRVWAGKSGENNDLLTTRYTRPNDWWFHVRGLGGSHVVLKMEKGQSEPQPRILEEAAAIAAYYSKMKNAKMVPVTACKGKYVRKPKGAAAGTVVVEREKVLYVEPHLPQEGEHE